MTGESPCPDACRASLPGIEVSAPGSLMLLGEHAVLRGARAVVMAVDRRMRVVLHPREGREVELCSALGSHRFSLEAIAPHPAFRFVLASIRRYARRVPAGFLLKIDSEFPPTIGFGSSAAVTTATLAALCRYAGVPLERAALLEEAIEIIREVQGMGSGADAAASIYGGLVGYRAHPLEARPLRMRVRGVAVYCGYKTPTPEVVRRVDEMWRGREAERRDLDERIDRLTAEAIGAIEAEDERALGIALNRGQELMRELGVSTPELEAIVSALRADPGILGAKISGSGLGDCVFGLGELTRPLTGWTHFAVSAAADGVLIVS